LFQDQVFFCNKPYYHSRSVESSLMTGWVCLLEICLTFSSINQNEVEVNLLPTVNRPVCLGARRPSGTRDKFFSLLEISFRQLRVCYFVAPSLTRGRVYNLLYNSFWSLPEQSLLGSKSHRTHDHILLPHLRLPQPGGPGPRVYIQNVSWS
jgi:hypothetical protein